MGDGNQLLPCRSIISQYKLDQKIGNETYDPEMETLEFWKDRAQSGAIFINGPVKPLLRHPKWLPLTCLNGDVLRYFDFDPAPGGTVGQIIEVDPECCSYEVLAVNFTELLENYFKDLLNGVYEVDEEHHINRIEQKEKTRGMPLWLKNA